MMAVSKWVMAKVNLLLRRRRKQSFQIVFDLDGPYSKHKEHFLAWLRDVTFAEKPTVGATVEETYRMIGRRDVWLLFNDVMNFDENQIKQFEEVHDEYFGND